MISLNLLQLQAKLRMMNQKDSGKSDQFWNNVWGKPRDYKNSGMMDSVKGDF